MPGVKYIAAGFVPDAEKLLADFVKENSPEFSVFTVCWKNHDFAAIFLGRSSSELRQFTHEIFQLTLKFLVTSGLYHQIGAVYLLYALFRNQIVNPPAKIRIILKQYQYFLEMRKLSIKEKYKTLHYIISYLFENAFDLVAHPTLVGPRNSKHRMELEKNALQMSCLLKDLKENSLSLFEDNAFGEIQEMDHTYTELTKKLPFKSDMFQDAADLDIKIHLKNLAMLISAERNDSEANSQSEKEYNTIGSRRSQIKSAAFASKAWFRQLNPTDDDDEDEENRTFTRSRAQRKSLSRKVNFPKDSTENEGDEDCDEKGIKLKKRRRTRLPKEKRRMGRPRKGQDLEQLLMEDEETFESNPLRGIRKRGPIARTSYLDRYIEQPFKEPGAEITMLSSSTSEEEEEENIDEPEEVITLEDDDDVLVF